MIHLPQLVIARFRPLNSNKDLGMYRICWIIGIQVFSVRRYILKMPVIHQQKMYFLWKEFSNVSLILLKTLASLSFTEYGALFCVVGGIYNFNPRKHEEKKTLHKGMGGVVNRTSPSISKAFNQLT